MEEKYNFKQVMAYGIVAFRNYLKSANNKNINAEQFGRLFIKPLEKIYRKDAIIKETTKIIDRNK